MFPSYDYESFDDFTVGHGCPTYGEDGSDNDVQSVQVQDMGGSKAESRKRWSGNASLVNL